MPDERLGEAGDGDVPPDVPGESRYVETNGMTLHAIDAGPPDGKLVVLLHGFPEFWYGWHEAIRPLANEGYRVLVPDQRGYNRSEKPEDVDDYRIDGLSADVVGLIDAAGRERAAIAGHDWGAGVGWWMALHHPDRISELIAVNVPHPTVIGRTLRRSWRQRLKLWHVAWFQLPRVPEAVARAGDWRLVVRGMRESSLPGTFSETDFDRYRTAWNQPGAFRSMIHWYRANARSRPKPERERVPVPTLVLWGAHDQHLLRSMAHESVDFCENGRVKIFHDATHWVQHELPIRVADAIADHVDDLPPGARE